MKKILPVVYAALLCAMIGCGGNKHVALKIGPVEVTAQEFEEAFQESRYIHTGEIGREMFLEQYIDTKLILLEAERMGLNRDPGFLKDIQYSWEQALLKRVVSEKNKEYSETVEVSEEEITNYYEQHKNDDFSGRSLSDVHDQVKWVLLKIQQSHSLSAWTGDLRKKADIKINKEALLGKKEQGAL